MASGISQDSALVLLPEIANLFSGRRGGGGGGDGGGGGRRGSFTGSGGVGQSGQTQPGEGTSGRQRETSRAVVFVVAADGTIEPRGVMIGLSDFNFTEIVSGLEEGDLIAIIGAADLRASQDRMRNQGRPDFRGGFR